jgi:hypothetical protein
MFTRKQYMDHEITHEEYYGEMAMESKIILPEDLIEKVKTSKDPHLNDIPLRIWDKLEYRHRDRMKEIAKIHNEPYSRSTGVCILKALARISI